MIELRSAGHRECRVLKEYRPLKAGLPPLPLCLQLADTGRPWASTIPLSKLRQTRHFELIGMAQPCAQPLTSGINNGTINSVMASVKMLLEQMRREPANVGFSDLKKVCQAYFGKPRQDASSHAILKTRRPGDPRVNVQNAKGKAKPYQVRQVLQAIDKLEGKP